MKYNFEQRKQNRIDNAINQSEKNTRLSDQQYNEAHKISSFIPMGQPILVGHHSEKRHRRDLDRIHNLHGQSIKSAERAAYYADKAKTIENNNAIFSDDPQALDKLRTKLKECEDLQTYMKAVNKCIKKNDKEAFLKLTGTNEEKWVVVNSPDCCKRIGFAHFELTNNGAEIRRLKARITQLEAVEKMESSESQHNGIIYRINVESNRVQLIFPGKPEEQIRSVLRSYGFRWAPSEVAWQRHLNNAGIYAAISALREIAIKEQVQQEGHEQANSFPDNQD